MLTASSQCQAPTELLTLAGCLYRDTTGLLLLVLGPRQALLQHVCQRHAVIAGVTTRSQQCQHSSHGTKVPSTLVVVRACALYFAFLGFLVSFWARH